MTIGATRVHIHPLLLLFLPLAVLLDAVGALFMALCILVLHELGHILIARALSLQVVSIEAAPYGGVLRMESLLEVMPGKEALVAMAGPAVNFLLAMGASLLDRYVVLPQKLLADFLSVNLCFCFLNLLPALPLDGGRVLRALLLRMMGIRNATRLCALIGHIVGVLLAAWGAASILWGKLNVTLLIVGVFLFFAAGREGKSASGIFLRDLTGRRAALSREGDASVRHIAAREEEMLTNVVARFSPRCVNRVVVLDEDMNEKMTLAEADITRAYLAHREVTMGQLARENKRKR